MAVVTTAARTALAFAAAVGPAAAVWLAKVMIWPRPFWAHFYDPETIHFYAGLHLLRGKVPENVDNPGTPLQMLSAGIAAFTGATPLRYEAFLSVAHLVELCLLIAGAAVLFWGVLGDTPVVARVTGVWLYFGAPQALERIDVWSPELLYLPLGGTALACFKRWSAEPSRRFAFATGGAIGLATACKFVFLPWAVALVLMLLAIRRIRDAVAAATGVGLGFVAGTLPVIGEYGFMLHRLLFLSGTGHADQTWLELLPTAKGWLLCVSAIVTAAAVFVRRERAALLVFCAAVIALSVLSAARNPSFRYLLPAAVAMAGVFAAAASSPRFDRRWQLVGCLLVAVLLAKAAMDDVSAHRRRIVTAESLTRGIAALVSPDAVAIYGWRAPVPSFALRVTTSDPLYWSAVERSFPRHGHLSPWTGRVHLPDGADDWTYAVVTETDAARIRRRDSVTIGRVGGFVVIRVR